MPSLSMFYGIIIRMHFDDPIAPELVYEEGCVAMDD